MKRAVFLVATLSAGLVTGCDPATSDESSPTSCSDPLLIDDMEDADGFICESRGRRGLWYTVGDGTSRDLNPPEGGNFLQTSIPEGRDTSQLAAHFTGSGFTGWGALMSFDLNQSGGQVQPYDLSAVNGIQFWLKSTVPVAVQFPIPETIPTSQPPGTCNDGVIDNNCHNNFHFVLGANDDNWTQYSVPFSALRQWVRGNALGNDTLGSAVWDPSRVVSIGFVAQTEGASTEFEVWVDDIRLYSCAGKDCLPTCTGEDPVRCPASDGRPADCWPKGTDCSNPPDITLTSVWGSGADDVWAVGFSPIDIQGRILHWDGTAWTRTTRGSRRPILGVWGNGPTDVWVVGQRGDTLQWGGSAWSTVMSGTQWSLNQGVWGSGPDDVWAAGAGGALIHWDGSSWFNVPSGTEQDLWGVWGSGPDDVWAVGTGGTLIHWDGEAWTPADSGTALHLDGVWGSGPSDVWVVGDAGTIQHWDGEAWTSLESGTTAFLDGIWGSGPNDVWVVGDAGTIQHWDGSAWSVGSSGTTRNLWGVWGSGRDDVWAVGEMGTILHWDGSDWSSVPFETSVPVAE